MDAQPLLQRIPQLAEFAMTLSATIALPLFNSVIAAAQPPPAFRISDSRIEPVWG